MSGAVERSAKTRPAKDLAGGAGETAPLKPNENFEGRPHLRACTCHPGERPDPCERKYAFHDCWRAAVQEETQALIVALKNRDRNAYEQLMLDYAMRVRTALEV